jgi:flagellar hook protein FlgE
MFDTIFIGTSGLLSHAKGLRVVGNNLANVNTPGFKSAQLQFANLFEQGSPGQQGASGSSGMGTGLATLGSHVNFRAGLDQSTGNPLDLNINGNGFFAIKRGDKVLYTRSGDFHFDSKGILVNSSGDHVMGLNGSGELAEVTLANLANNMPKATSTVTFSGNLTSIVAVPAVNAKVNGITVLDAEGKDHPVSLTFQDNGAGDYTVTVKDSAGATLTTGTLKFSAGFPVAGNNSISFSYAPAGVAAFDVKLDFSSNVTSLVSSTTLGVASQDGYAAGVRTDQTIESDGTVTLHYSNGQTAKGPRLALANFGSDDDLEQGAGSAFLLKPGASVQYGYAGSADFGTLAAGHREGSNVDLAEEFGNLILMQRGYQASSHVISTANDMIQQLFDMKGNR